MEIGRTRARAFGWLGIAVVIGAQAFNSFTCYGHDFGEFLSVLGYFLALPLVPALVALFTRNPLRAVGASLLLLPWLVLAYYTDCVRPDQGGGASMVYVAVLLWGSVTSVVGALLAGPVMRLLGVTVSSVS